MKNMRLISSIFGINKSLPEGPCTSYSLEDQHGRCLDFQIYLGVYKPHSATFRGAIALPKYIQEMEERRPYGKGEIRGNGILLSTFDGVTSARAWEKKLEAFYCCIQWQRKKQ